MSSAKRKSSAEKENVDSEVTTPPELPVNNGEMCKTQECIAASNSSDLILQTAAEESELQLEPVSKTDQIERMQPDSLAAIWLLEHRSVLRELHSALVRHVIFYTKSEGGGMTMEEAINKATQVMEGSEVDDYYKNLTSMSIKSISWLSIDRLIRYNPEAAQTLWEDLKEQAELDFKSGHFAAQIFERAEWQKDPWKRAHFIAVRDSFVDQFKPQGGIDYSMIDMLAVTFTLWMHWTEVHMHRSTTEAISQPSKTEKQFAVEYGGEWMPPRAHEQEAIDHAAQMADRWRRAYQATLRQMRDWRRYSVPLTINNPQQVNIAAEGGQQINLQESAKKL
jgi:hypothetical protein